MPMIRTRFSPCRAPHLLRLLLCGILIAGTARADDLADVQRLSAAGQGADALKKADELLATKPKDAALRFAKGVLLVDAKRSAEAIDVFRDLTEDHPDLAEPYNNLAALYAAEGEFQLARSTLEQALRTNPGYAVAHENLGDVYAMLATQSYAQALKLAPMNASVPPKLALVRELFRRGPAASATAP